MHFVSAVFFYIILILTAGCVSQNSVVKPLVKSLYQVQAATIYIKPTIYYLPIYKDTDHKNCDLNSTHEMKTVADQVIVKTCEFVAKSCEMQGTCLISHGKKTVLVTIDQKDSEGRRRFQEIDPGRCKYGFGASSDGTNSFSTMCIDPFYSVAADLSIYNLGDVIYIPRLKNTKLPNGEKHNGYFIVRDSGQLIKGEGRFDFYTGYFSANKKNPFVKMGFASNVEMSEFRMVTGVEAESIRTARRFPFLRK